MQATINFNIPNSESWTPEMCHQWLKENLINPAMIAHSENALKLLEEPSVEAQSEAKKYHGLARSLLLADFKVI